MEVTKDQFESYRRVQEEGRFNMLSSDAQKLTGLDKETYFAIIENYGELLEKYGDDERV